MPCASVVVVARTVPVELSRVTVTPAAPTSVGFWIPLPLVSIHTRCPISIGAWPQIRETSPSPDALENVCRAVCES